MWNEEVDLKYYCIQYIMLNQPVSVLETKNRKKNAVNGKFKSSSFHIFNITFYFGFFCVSSFLPIPVNEWRKKGGFYIVKGVFLSP